MVQAVQQDAESGAAHGGGGVGQGGAVEGDVFACTGDTGVKEFATKMGEAAVIECQGDVCVFRSLRFVDGHGVGVLQLRGAYAFDGQRITVGEVQLQGAACAKA